MSAGGLLLSLESNRFAVVFTDSSPLTSQPKFAAGSFSHDCTSAAICAALQVYVPVAPTDWLALTGAEKSPPCAVQRTVSKKRWRQVASPIVAGGPPPPFLSSLRVFLPPPARRP